MDQKFGGWEGGGKIGCGPGTMVQSSGYALLACRSTFREGARGPGNFEGGGRARWRGTSQDSG